MVSFRRAVKEDAGRIAEFQLCMALESEGIHLDPNVVEKGVLSVFESSHWGHYYVAEAHKDLLGSALIQYEWSDWRNAVIWWIHSVYVVPEHRRKGIFRSIFELIHREAVTCSGVKGLRLYVEKNNRIAQQCYRELGMSSDRYDLYETLFAGR